MCCFEAAKVLAYQGQGCTSYSQKWAGFWIQFAAANGGAYAAKGLTWLSILPSQNF